MADPSLAPQEGHDPSFADLIAGRPALALDPLAGLMVEEVPLARLAARHGTPLWVISAGTLRRRYRALAAALAGAGLAASIHYAAKANDALAVLRLLAAEGAGADVVSVGELRAAEAAGIPPARIVYSGVGKTRAELAAALAGGVFQINAESAEEITMISEVAAATGHTAPVALRVNPDVDARTHAKITTGKAENKFGIPYEEAPALYARMAGLPGIRPVGLATHIGSQITAGTAAFRAAYARLADLARELLSRGLPVARLDCGGGLGIAYRDEIPPTPEAFAGAIAATVGRLGLPVMVEPGRWIAGPAGFLLASVILEKHSGGRRFVVVDAAMNDLLRPALYEAWHGILPVAPERLSAPLSPAEVVGPVCESGDTFARGRLLPRFAEGDLVLFCDAGAYGAVMSSTYNARPLAAQVMVEGARAALIRPRQSHADLLAGQAIPPWLAG
jgi:diaminopimelate decarboxylase